MYRNNGIDSLKNDSNEINMLPPLSPRPHLLENINFNINLHSYDFANKRKIMEKSNFNRIMGSENILPENNKEQKRMLAPLDSLNELEIKKGNLRKEINEMSLILKELEKKKLKLIKEIENLSDHLKELKKEEDNLNIQLIEMKYNYDICIDKIQIMEKNKKINKKEKLNAKLYEDIDEKNKLLEKREKEIKQLEKDKKVFHNEIKNYINNKIDNIFNKTMTKEEIISDVSYLGSFLKDSITKEKKLNPDNFIDPKKYIKSIKKNETTNKTILPLYLISNWLEENGCQVAIEKKSKNIKFNLFCMQQIFNNKAIEKKFTLVFDNNYNDDIINKENSNNYINFLKNDMSKYLQIPTNEIFIMNPRGPPFTIDLYVEYLNDFKKTRIKEYIRTKRKEIIKLKESILLEGCKLSPEIFDPKYDMKPNDWPKNPSQRANIDYYPPYNYTGFGLKVLGAYDNGDNTWIGMCNKEGEFAVAYHGIRSSIEAVKNILNSHLKAGEHQAFENDEDELHFGNICGKGVYVTPKIDVAENYTKPFYAGELNQYFRIVFQCRVNPKKRRQPKHKPEYWILNGNGQEIRPYRLLVKQEKNSCP